MIAFTGWLILLLTGATNQYCKWEISDDQSLVYEFISFNVPKTEGSRKQATNGLTWWKQINRLNAKYDLCQEALSSRQERFGLTSKSTENWAGCLFPRSNVWLNEPLSIGIPGQNADEFSYPGRKQFWRCYQNVAVMLKLALSTRSVWSQHRTQFTQAESLQKQTAQEQLKVSEGLDKFEADVTTVMSGNLTCSN